MGGGLKAQIFNGKYMAKLEFLVGWVGLKPESCGGRGVWVILEPNILAILDFTTVRGTPNY